MYIDFIWLIIIALIIAGSSYNKGRQAGRVEGYAEGYQTGKARGYEENEEISNQER